MNVGLEAATGEYIGIVESDDYILPEMYEILYQTAKKYDVDFVKSDFKRFYGDKENRIFENVSIYDDKKYYNTILNPQNDPLLFKMYNTNWNGLFETNFIKKNKICFNETPGASFQDNGFWFISLAKATKIYCLTISFYMLRRDNPNSSINSKEKIFCMCDEYEYINGFLKKNPLLEKKFIKMYVFKKFHNYMFTYNRISDRFKSLFMERFKKELKKEKELNLIDENLFSKKSLNEINGILNNKQPEIELLTKKPKISVIIPVYNTENYLHDCLNSVINQTLVNIEIICINDGSTDNSYEILKKYKNNDNRISIINQARCGAGVARNKGIEIAKGEYLSFLDSDDFFEKNLLKISYDKCKNDDADIGIYKVLKYDHVTKKEIQAHWAFINEYIPKNIPFSYKDMPKYIFNTFQNWPWNKMFKRLFIKEKNIKFQDTLKTNDLFFTCSALVLAQKITVIDEYLVHYRTNTGSSTQQTNDESPLDFYNAFLKLKKFLILKSYYHDVEQSFINSALNGSIYNLKSLKKRKNFLELYEKIKNEIAISFDFLDKNGDYFYNKNNYNDFLLIQEDSMDAFLTKNKITLL